MRTPARALGGPALDPKRNATKSGGHAPAAFMFGLECEGV
jgi:hypothetical protein